MAVLQLVSEEPLCEDTVHEYFEDLYKIICVSERPGSRDMPTSIVRSTYVVDWEQLVHLLEDYSVFGEDIVEVTPVSSDEAQVLRGSIGGSSSVARA